MEILGTGKHKLIGIVSVLGFITAILFIVSLGNVTTSMSEARELTLQGDLLTMRSLIRDYTAQQHKRPESLNDLVAEGYIQHIPKDPITGRDDTWVEERSQDTAMRGIVNVRSGASGISRKGSRYADW